MARRSVWVQMQVEPPEDWIQPEEQSAGEAQIATASLPDVNT